MEQSTATKKICFACCKTSHSHCLSFITSPTGLNQDIRFNLTTQGCMTIELSNSPMFSSVLGLGSENLSVTLYICDDCIFKSDLINRLLADNEKIRRQFNTCMSAFLKVLMEGKVEKLMEKSQPNKLRMNPVNIHSINTRELEVGVMEAEENEASCSTTTQQNRIAQIQDDRDHNEMEADEADEGDAIPENREHFQLSSGPKQGKEDDKVFLICEVCGKICPTKKLFEEHRKAHDSTAVGVSFARSKSSEVVQIYGVPHVDEMDAEEPLDLSSSISNLTAMRNKDVIPDIVDNVDNMEQEPPPEAQRRNEIVSSATQDLNDISNGESLQSSSGQKKAKKDVVFLQCPLQTCGKTYRTKNPFDLHLAFHNGTACHIKCKYCGNSFKIVETQKTHLVKFHPYELFMESYPQESTKKNFELAIQSVLTKIKNDPGRCSQCLKYQEQKELKEHVLKNHLNEVKKAIEDIEIEA